MSRTSFTIAHLIAFFLVASCSVIRTLRDPANGDVFRALELPDADYSMVEFLLLLPMAALVVCVFRNVIGLPTFGTFAPALLGLAFRQVPGFAGGGILLSILLFGWVFRRAVHRLHLLQVPRTAFMLSLVVCFILGLVFVSHAWGVSLASSLPLLPLVIVTGMIERFWSMEEEEGTAVSLQTLLNTLGIAALIMLLARIPEIRRELSAHPETIGFIMAGQLLVGRYLGYRLTELHRFRSALHAPSQD